MMDNRLPQTERHRDSQAFKIPHHTKAYFILLVNMERGLGGFVKSDFERCFWTSWRDLENKDLLH